MSNSWKEVELALETKRCELIISGSSFSERIEKEGLDPGLFRLKSLNFLEISNTCLKELPSSISDLTNLSRVVLRGNAFESLPAEICKLGKLKFLDVSQNALTVLPEDLGALTDLQALNVRCNQLSKMPALGTLINLVLLNISNNQFQELPASLFSKNLIHFTELLANNNQIAELPHEVSNLSCLKVLNLGENVITALPGELGACTKLRDLNLKGNKLKDKRLHKLVEQCHAKQILDYVRTHCPKANSDDTHTKSKKKAKQNKNNLDNEAITELLDKIQILHVCDQTPKIVTTAKAGDIRPYIVSCIVRDVDFQGGTLLKKFITTQTKLHDGVCEKRTVATIATHDLSKVEGDLLYDARPPQEIKVLPLNKKKEMSATELYKSLNEEADALRKEKKKNTYSGIHKYLYLLKDKPLYPCLLDSGDKVISLPPITNSDGTKISEDTKHMLLEVTGTNLNTCKKVMDTLVEEMFKLGMGSQKEGCHVLVVEQVKVVDEEGQLKVVYPSRTDMHIEGILINRE